MSRPHVLPARACCCGCNLRVGVQCVALLFICRGIMEVVWTSIWIRRGRPRQSLEDTSPESTYYPEWISWVKLLFALFAVWVGLVGARAANSTTLVANPPLALLRARSFYRLFLVGWVVELASGTLDVTTDEDEGGAVFNLVLGMCIQTYLLFIVWSFYKRLCTEPIAVAVPRGLDMNRGGGGAALAPATGIPVGQPGAGVQEGIPVALPVGTVAVGHPWAPPSVATVASTSSFMEGPVLISGAGGGATTSHREEGRGPGGLEQPVEPGGAL